MQRKIVSLLMGGLCLSQLAFADTESRLSELERQMDQVRVVTPNETCGATTALARPVLDECDGCCGENFWIEMEAIFWHAKVGCTTYAYTDLDENHISKGRIKQIDFEWDWGLKVGAGYNFAHDGWDLRGQYTWYDTGASDRVSTPGNTQFVIPMRGFVTIEANTDLIDCKKATSQFELHFQAVNVELGREFYVSEYLSLHPYFGLKGAIFDLEQITRYYGGDTLGNNTYHVQDESKFWGVGALAGMDANYHLGKGFSLYGDFSADLVYGHSDSEYRDRYSIVHLSQRRIRFNRHMFVPALEFMLGIQWDKYFWEDEKHLRIRLSYESQYWWRVNQMLQANTIGNTSSSQTSVTGGREVYRPCSEDVSFHGCTFEVRVDF